MSGQGSTGTTTGRNESNRPPPEKTREFAHDEKPPLNTIINLYDFEEIASRVLDKKTWAFYSSAATDCITRDANNGMLRRIWWRPRILRNVRNVSTETTILGCKANMPLFVSPAALAKMVHPDGEKALARACVARGIPQGISTNASFHVQDIVAEGPETHSFFFQLYVNTDRQKTEALLKHILDLAPRVKGLILTVDSPVPGKREADERIQADETLNSATSGVSAKNDKKGGGVGRIMGAWVDSSLNWEDLKWIREQIGPDMPLVLKGVGTAADTVLAMKAGCQGVILSNHGGRSLDTATPSILVLLELQKSCPEVFDRMEIFVDGGIRRGTDILKCLCLGATAVGIGRHFLYSLMYGQEGTEHLIELLQDELEVSMRMLGITDLSQVHPGLVNTGDVDHMIPSHMEEHPYAKWRPKSSKLKNGHA